MLPFREHLRATVPNHRALSSPTTHMTGCPVSNSFARVSCLNSPTFLSGEPKRETVAYLSSSNSIEQARIESPSTRSMGISEPDSFPALSHREEPYEISRNRSRLSLRLEGVWERAVPHGFRPFGLGRARCLREIRRFPARRFARSGTISNTEAFETTFRPNRIVNNATRTEVFRLPRSLVSDSHASR